MSREKVVLDVDDVLYQSAQGFTDISNQRWGTNFVLGDYTEHWTEWWGISTEEVKIRNDIIWEEGLPASFIPVDGAQEGVAELATHKDLVVVTSRPDVAEKTTVMALHRDFGDVFQEIVFAGFYNTGAHSAAYKLTKAAIIHKLGARHAVDDLPKHANPTAELGLGSVLFGDYHWQQDIDLHQGVVRAIDWKATTEHFDATR